MLNKKEKVLNYCSQDPSAAEYFHDFYVDMMNDIRILGQSDFLKLSGNELDAEKYIVVDVSPITYIEVSNTYVFNIQLYTDENLHTRKDFVESYAQYKIESILEEV
jgi:hypothetical protein